MSEQNHIQSVPLYGRDEEHRRQLATAINQVLREEGLPPRYATVFCPLDVDMPPGVETTVFFSTLVPAGLSEESSVVPSVHWKGVTGDVAWAMELTVANTGGVATVTQRAAAAPAAGDYVLTQFLEVPTAANVGAIIHGTIRRDGAAATDTHDGTARLFGVSITFEVDAKGSQDVFKKYRETY